MEYRSLGRTGVQVSELCLGTMMFGGRADEADSLAMIDTALDAGVNFVDTANAYSAKLAGVIHLPRDGVLFNSRT